LITLDDVKEEMDLGPNGGLVFCLEYNFSFHKTHTLFQVFIGEY